jgi:hypothetical protein
MCVPPILTAGQFPQTYSQDDAKASVRKRAKSILTVVVPFAPNDMMQAAKSDAFGRIFHEVHFAVRRRNRDGFILNERGFCSQPELQPE